jgi:hypothetical protein
MPKKNQTRYATIKADFNYRDYIGDDQCFKKGKRIGLNRLIFFDKENNLIWMHFFGYGQALIIPAEFMHENKNAPSLIARYM